MISLTWAKLSRRVYTLAYFSFLRLSNLVPHSSKLFSPFYHFARGDIIFAPPGLQVIIKWSKTMQARNVAKILKIPALGRNPICPVQENNNILAIAPGENNNPLFQYKPPKGWFPMTDSHVRHHFKLIF